MNRCGSRLRLEPVYSQLAMRLAKPKARILDADVGSDQPAVLHTDTLDGRGQSRQVDFPLPGVAGLWFEIDVNGTGLDGRVRPGHDGDPGSCLGSRGRSRDPP